MGTRRTIWVCCTGFGPRPSAERYFSLLSGVELQQTFVNPPRLSTLQRLRQQAPPEFAFVVKAWQLITHESSNPSFRRLPRSITVPPGEAGHFRDSTTVRSAVHRTMEAVSALDAAAVLFESPPSFTPTAAHRQRLRRFFESLDRRNRLVVWYPQGLWSAADTWALCRDLRLVPCWDPFADPSSSPAPPPVDDSLYVRLPGLGVNQSYTETQLRDLVELLAHLPRAFCVFGSPSLFSHAARMQQIVDEEGLSDEPADPVRDRGSSRHPLAAPSPTQTVRR